MMKVFVLACVLTVVAASSRHYKAVDNLDFEVFFDEKAGVYDYRASIDCFLDKIPCGHKEMKATLLDILKTRCAYCSESMLQKYNWVLQTLKEKHPEDYTAIMNKVSNTVL